MFKQANKQLGKQQQKCARVPARGITTNRMIINENLNLTKARKQMLNVYGQLDGNLGVVQMNREHRYNTLTPNMISNIVRGVETMDNDHIATTIYLGSAEQEHFSNGTDFRTIAHMKKEDNYGRIQEYLQQLYTLQTKIASVNKPLIALATGHALNSGAALLAAAGHPMTTMNTKLAFNEVTFGFVPHSGATYYLSRMPGEFGTFMALTGLPIHGTDAARIELTKGIVHNPVEYSQEISDVVNSLEYPGISGNDIFKKHPNSKFLTPWQHYLYERDVMQDQFRVGDAAQLSSEKLIQNQLGDFIKLEDRKVSSVADAEYRYKQLLRKNAKDNNVEAGYLEYMEGNPDRSSNFLYKNYYSDQLKYIASHINQTYPNDSGFAANHQQLIDRCFFGNSVEQIMENLRKENHPFATECLKQMEKNSMLSMQLALRMVRKAVNLDYKSTLQMELDVAFSKIQDKDFDIGVHQILMSPKVKGAKTKVAQFEQQVKPADLEKYFEPSKWSQSIDLGIVENALLPTKQYYERFSDQVRLWLNESSTTQGKIREQFDQEAKEALREHGIDVRDKALNPQIARSHIAAKLSQENYEKVFKQRTEQLMIDTKLRENYFSQIKSHLDTLEKDQTLFYNQVNQHISGVFQDALITRLDTIYKQSKKVHSLEKRRMFVQLKKFLFKSRILSYGNEQIERQMKQLQSMPFQQIHLTEKWDQSFREGQHPDLVHTPLYYLSKAIGRVSLTTPELAKTYLTNPGNREQMTMLLLDQNELEKLQADVISNPEKYEMMLTNYSKQTADSKLSTKMDRGLSLSKQEEQEYWFRVMNDGMCPLDSFPYAREFSAYKEWADQIESKAVDTLRMCIDKLLIEAKSEKKVYEGKLQNLLRIVNQVSDEKNEKSKPSSESKSILGNKVRSVSDLKQTLRSVLNEQMGFNFENQQESIKIKTLRNELEDELLSLVEIILLNKYGYANPKERALFEQRLADLTNPSGLPNQQLNVIDHYLSRKNGEVLVKDAINLALPFFSQLVKSKLQEESKKILQKFKVQDTQPQVLLYYFFNQALPESAKSGVFQRFLNYSFQQDVQEAVTQGIVPYASSKFQRRDLIALMGHFKPDPNLSVGEKQFASMQQTQKELSDLQTFDQNVAKQQFKRSSDAERDLHLNLSQQEIRDLQAIEYKILDVYEWLHDHKYEIDHHLTELDYLNMYAEAILNQGFDMTAVSESGDDQSWAELAKYAKFVHQFGTQVQKVASTQNFDAIAFIQHKNSKNPQQEILYNSIAAERARLQNQQNAKSSFDRHSLIRGQIDDFNKLQQRVSQESTIKKQIQQLVASKSKEVQATVLEYLSSPSSFVDFESLHQSLQANDLKFLSEPSLIIDAPKLLSATKPLLNNIIDHKVDVLSLSQLQSVVDSDDSSNAASKKQISLLVNYVNDQTKYISNSDRRNISIGDYVNKYSFASLQSIDLLKNPVFQDKQDSAIIDWQLGSSRTHPSEHLSVTDAEKVLQRAENAQSSKQSVIVNHKNPTTGLVEQDSVRDYELKQVMRQARELSELPNSMIATKNLYENKLLQNLLKSDAEDSETNEIVEAYTQLRLKSCLLNSEFAQQMKTDNAHIYLKVLREQVIDELGLSKPPQLVDLAFNTITQKSNISAQYDLEAPYNLQNLNNQDAIGYDNLTQRAKAESAEENFNLAHETVFDKLLADYFLGKRGEYKESNKLLKDLAEIFEDPKITNSTLSPMEQLTLVRLNQEVNKSEDPLIAPENFRNLMKLDVAASRAIQQSKNGLSQSLRNLSIDQEDHPDYFKTQIPEYFDLFDVRKPASKYVEDKLRSVIQESFDVRAQLEPSMTRRELLAFDKVLARYLQHKNLMPKLRKAIEQDYSQLQQGKSLVEQTQDSKHNQQAQLMKFQNKQRALNKSTLNEDAEFKVLAFNAANERKNQQLIDTKEGLDLLYNQESFAEWYKQELLSDAKRPPRQINPNEFQPKKPWEYAQGEFQNARQREESFYKDHQVYLEKKKEQQDRIQLFYIFEQFYETARQKPDPVSQAQQHIRQYFAEPENTFFFDKNKIF